MDRMKTAIATATAALLLAILIARQPAKDEAPPRRMRKAGTEKVVGTPVPVPSPLPEEPREEPADRPAPTPASSGQESFWDGLAELLAERPASDLTLRRHTVLARTADHLGLEGSARTAFAATAASVVEEIAQAWAVREQLILTLPAEREDEEAAIQGRYEELKRQALERLEVLLGGSAPHCGFRSRLEEWIDTLRQ